MVFRGRVLTPLCDLTHSTMRAENYERSNHDVQKGWEMYSEQHVVSDNLV